MSRRTYLGWDKEQSIAKARNDHEYRNGVNGDVIVWPHKCNKCSNKDIFDSLNEFRSRKLFSDAVIILGDGGIFPVHRIVLSSCSNYFRVLFTTTLHTEELRKCTLPHIKSPIMKQLLDYVYENRIEFDLTNVLDVLHASDYLNMVEILKLCCDYLMQRITFENCICIFKSIRHYRDRFCVALADYVYRFLMQNFIFISRRNYDILNMPVAELELLLSAEELNVENEEYVWECILRWIGHDQKNRKKYMATLLPHVRFGLMDPNFFFKQVLTHPLVKGEENRPYILYALKYLSNLSCTSVTNVEEIGRPRISHDLLFAIGGWSGTTATSSIEAYDCRLETWGVVPHEDPTGPRAYHATAVFDYCIFVIGGFDGLLTYHSSVRCYDVVLKTWEEKAAMHYKRCYIGVATMGSLIFAMGGYNGNYRQNTAESYNLLTNQWTLISPMNLQRSDASAAALNGRIYIAGGFNGIECMSSVEMYDPTLNQWTFIAPMYTRRSGTGCVSYNGFIYAMGGFNGSARLSSVERYDPIQDKWSPVTSMLNPRSNFGFGILDNLIFVVGGYNGVITFSDVECYDYNNDSWYKINELLVPRSAASVCVVSGLPNTTEYICRPDFLIKINDTRPKLFDFVDFSDVKVVEQMDIERD